MPNQFFEQPILNSPYAYPGRHWELDADGQPTNNITESRRRSAFITPVPKPKKRRGADAKKQTEILFPEPENISTAEQQYDTNTIINEIRQYVDQWRKLPNPDQWQVTPETARLLQHWRHHQFSEHPPVLLPDRSRRNRHLADRGRARKRKTRQASSSTIWPTPTRTPTPSCCASP